MPNPRNLLPAPQQGMVGWWDRAGSVHRGVLDGVLTTTGLYDAVASHRIAGGYAATFVPVKPGRPYTFAVDVDQLAIAVLRWVNEDSSLGERVTGYGNGRASVTGVAPASAKGVVCTVWHGAVTAVNNGDGTATLSFPAGLRPPDMPYVIAVDSTPAAQLRIAHPVLVRSTIDPGYLPESDDDDSLGWRLYSELPDLYRQADLDRQLWHFVKGATVGADDVRAVSGRIAGGALTDPALVPDAWVGWLAQMLGVPAAGTPAQVRQLVAAHDQAPAPGTHAALAALTRSMLTGTQRADVYPSSSQPWVIMVRVRSDELGNFGADPALLAAALMATGQVPAGFAVQVTTAQQTWAQMDTATPTWAAAEGQDWGRVDSRGL